MKTSKDLPWAVVCTLALAVSLGGFVLGARGSHGFRAGDPTGLAFGGGAFAIFLFEALLSLRRSKPAWHLGHAATWLRAHVWLGSLAFAWCWLHAGFRARGVVSALLLSLVSIVTCSGLLGWWIHKALPRILTERVPRETIGAQIPGVVESLKEEAEGIVTAREDAELQAFYAEELSSFLQEDVRAHPLLDPSRRARLFSQAQKRFAPQVAEALTDLADICEERAQLFTQERLERWLFGWRLVHVPLSFSLLVLTAAHAIVTLAY